MYSQLLSENEYLRNANERVIGIYNPYYLSTTNNLTENNINQENKNDHEIYVTFFL
jgi:hypothetical protein